MRDFKVIVIIPAYNESLCIEETIRSLRKIDADLLVVNDGSTDNTGWIARRCGVPVIELTTNLGVGGAMQTGYRYALSNGYDIAIQFDADGQHNADYVPALVNRLVESEADLVIGSRFIRNDLEGFKSTHMRRLGSRFLVGLIYLFTGRKITDPTSGFRAASRRGIRLFSEIYPQDYPEPESLVILHNHNLLSCEVPVEMFERRGGESKIRFSDSILYMIKVTTSVFLEMFRGKNRVRL